MKGSEKLGYGGGVSGHALGEVGIVHSGVPWCALVLSEEGD